MAPFARWSQRLAVLMTTLVATVLIPAVAWAQTSPAALAVGEVLAAPRRRGGGGGALVLIFGALCCLGFVAAIVVIVMMVVRRGKGRKTP